MPARAAIRMGTSGIWLDLDVDDAADEDEADEHHHATDSENEQAGGQAEQLGWLLEHRLHEGRRDDRHDDHQADRQEADDVARHALLGRESLDLALDTDALADR